MAGMQAVCAPFCSWRICIFGRSIVRKKHKTKLYSMPLGAQRVKQLHLIFLEPYTTIEEDTKGNIRPLHQLQNRNQRQQTNGNKPLLDCLAWLPTFLKMSAPK